nr:EamA family transporter [Clostridia bacterium]
MKLSKTLGALLIIAAGIMWGTMGLFVRFFNGIGLTSLDIVAVRIIFTTLILIPCVAIFKPSALKIKLRDIWCFIGTGLFSIVFFNLCYFSTISTASLGTAAVLLYTAPIFVMLMSAFLFKEKLTVKKIIACIAAFVGCMFVSGIITGGLTLTPSALLTGLGSGIGYALYSIFGRYALDRGYSSLTITVYTFVFALIGMLPIMDYGTIFTAVTSSYMPCIVGVLMGIVVSILPYLLYTAGLSVTEGGKASVMASVEPVTAALVGLVCFHEVPGVFELCGIVIILGSITALNIEFGKKQNK